MWTVFLPKGFKNGALVREIGQLQDVFSSTVNAAVTMLRSCALFLFVFVIYVKNDTVSKKKVPQSDQRFESCPTSEIFYAYFHRNIPKTHRSSVNSLVIHEVPFGRNPLWMSQKMLESTTVSSLENRVSMALSKATSLWWYVAMWQNDPGNQGFHAS